MRTTILFFMAAASSAMAAELIKLPSLVKPLTRLESVMSDAAKERKAISFLLMDPTST
jgi:hypothetical protein